MDIRTGPAAALVPMLSEIAAIAATGAWRGNVRPPPSKPAALRPSQKATRLAICPYL
jgi:hypothetical protein